MIARAAVLALIGILVGGVSNGLRSDGVHPSTFAAPTSCQMAAAPSAVEVLSPQAASALCGDAGTVVADARSPERFAEGHIAGALHLPCAASGAAATDAFAHVANKTVVVVYADSTDEARVVAESLRRQTLTKGVRVAVIDGGFAAWSAAGLACSSGPCADCAWPHSSSEVR